MMSMPLADTNGAITAKSADLQEAIRQNAPPSTPDGRDQWILLLSWLAAGFAVAAATAALIMYWRQS